MAPIWTQKTLQLPAKAKGCYLITSDISSQLSSELKGVKVGLLHLFMQHTSAALTLNEKTALNLNFDYFKQGEINFLGLAAMGHFVLADHAARMIRWPLCLLYMDIPVDGADAFVGLGGDAEFVDDV